LSLAGLLPFGIPVERVYFDAYEDVWIFQKFGSRGLNTRVRFERAYIFDNNNLMGLDAISGYKPEFTVYDWYDFSDDFQFSSDQMEPGLGKRFASEFHFYRKFAFLPDDRKAAAVCVSHLWKDELQEFDFSEKILTHLLQKCINEDDLLWPDTKPQLRHDEREIEEKYKKKYRNTKKIKFVFKTLEEIGA
jgi:hypothetical protein